MNNALDRIQQSTWIDSWVFPYESIWSLIHKFGNLNWISCLELKKTLAKEGGDIKGHLKNPSKYGKWNLLSAEGFDFNKIRELLNLPGYVVEMGLVSTIIGKDELALLTATKHLRYCPHCISVGFHSIFHQLYAIKNCPIHDRPLIEFCRYCKKRFLMSC